MHNADICMQLPQDADRTFTIGQNLRQQVEEKGFVVAKSDVFGFSTAGREEFRKFQDQWNQLGNDTFYSKQGQNGFRVRAYSDFDFNPFTDEFSPRTHVPYYQSERMNRYVGGAVRHFTDVQPETYENPFFQDLVRYDFSLFPVIEEFLDRQWVCQVHMIRIVVGENQSTPVTPEGIHSDGYPFAGVHLINRNRVEGGESSVYTYEEQVLARVTFENPLDSLWFEDRKLKHYVTPISGLSGDNCHRDILAISFSLPDSPYTTDI